MRTTTMMFIIIIIAKGRAHRGHSQILRIKSWRADPHILIAAILPLFRLKELRGDYRLWKKKLVYTFKTKHGRTPESPAGTSYPIYEEISGSDQTQLGRDPQGTCPQKTSWRGRSKQLSPLVKKILPRSWSHVYDCIQLQYTHTWAGPHSVMTVCPLDLVPNSAHNLGGWHLFCIRFAFLCWGSTSGAMTTTSTLSWPIRVSTKSMMPCWSSLRRSLHPWTTAWWGRSWTSREMWLGQPAEATARKFASGRPKNLLWDFAIFCMCIPSGKLT